MSTTTPDAPLVSAEYVRDGLGGMVWLLNIACPYCARTHTHGGGSGRGTARDFLGHRTAHCPSRAGRSSSAGYDITDPAGILA